MTNISNVTIVKEDDFEKVIKDGNVISMKFHQEVPYCLMVKLDYVAMEAVIEFTGKILRKDYKKQKLISLDTIRQCFLNINAMGFCNIDIEEVTSNSQVVKCDVTKDVDGMDIQKISNYI